eukprot:gene14178-biopygen34257
MGESPAAPTKATFTSPGSVRVGMVPGYLPGAGDLARTCLRGNPYGLQPRGPTSPRKGRLAARAMPGGGVCPPRGPPGIHEKDAALARPAVRESGRGGAFGVWGLAPYGACRVPRRRARLPLIGMILAAPRTAARRRRTGSTAVTAAHASLSKRAPRCVDDGSGAPPRRSQHSTACDRSEASKSDYDAQEPRYNLTGAELRETLARMSARQAGGMEGWRVRELKALPEALLDALAEVLNVVEHEGRWPAALERALITLIPKGEGGEPECMRPISVMSAVYRLWAATRMRDIRVWQEEWAALSQHGYRPLHGTEDVYWALQLRLEEALLS